jgi:hypothetical protein
LLWTTGPGDGTNHLLIRLYLLFDTSI